ncbi:MAG TPA: NIPSNAP family protein, partial [Bacillales bacterium]|nr:NIPSNAP family protein [Bacillales bacterium]
MIYRRKTYQIDPSKAEAFNEFFNTYLLPNQLKHGSKLVGRWITEDKTEITAIWEYESYEAYLEIEEAVRNDPMAETAREVREPLLPLYISAKQDFLASTV